jgi:4-amino-4-deoxy-L-arabinose transferase-like glycosyltransferase
VAWSLVVPPFQFADEPHHIAYVQYVAEAGRPPPGTSGRPTYSAEQFRLMRALRYKQFERRPENRPLTTPAAQRQIRHALQTPADRLSPGGYNRATSNPPLYYALEALAYEATPSASLLNRIEAMRLVSALLAAVTVLLVFLFLRELLPRTPWSWTVGALAVALQPLFNNESGAVNPDNLLYPAAAGIFLALALSFRRGLTVPRGVALGAMTAVALLTKPSAIGLLPGVALGVLLLAWRADRSTRATALRGAAAAVVVAGVPILVYAMIASHFWDRGLYTGAFNALSVAGGAVPAPRGSTAPAQGQAQTITGFLSYLWQFYLPRLPFMDQVRDFTYWPFGHIWFDGFVGRFGAREYGLPGIADGLAAAVYLVIVALTGRELIAHRPALRSRAAELITYLAILGGMLLVIHLPGYQTRLKEEGDWEQARYLLPLLPLYGAIIALAARGAGRRYGPAVAVLIVSLAAAHSLLSFVVTITRYYG